MKVHLCPPKSLPENRVLVQLSVLLTETQGMKGTFRDGETSLGMTLENQKQTLKHFVLTQLSRTLPIDPPGAWGPPSTPAHGDQLARQTGQQCPEA